MEHKQISKIVHLHTYDLTDILNGSDHKHYAANEMKVMPILNKNCAWSHRNTAKIEVRLPTLIPVDSKNYS